MFRKGDRVVYPHHGAAVIQDLVERDLDGERRTYFMLHVTAGNLTLMVPIGNTEQVGLREVVSRGEVEAVFDRLREEEAWPPFSWSKRYKMNMAKLSSGDIYELAELIRDLTCREKVAALASSERALLAKARSILLSELVFALECVPEDAEATLDAVLAETRMAWS
jgi:CarD family transcriptional regulator